ncbi:glutamate racemase [Fulvivirga lutea]|uniref:Aspartate/glutamate racemase family protein n=1 Tax=Fulvivirga lutea TaxID=2810512 RepID=A0A974WIQ5_9BACT|nr:aspartate/glutamate racemase family protein [Fulvivirga lutea]QSE99181.1 aspartate/glutamate racemase family protein [Fulvivirga lutea]
MINRLAIYDYGIGGIDLYLRIKDDFPELGITYFSDSGEVPYGKLDSPTLSNRVNKVIDFLVNDGCTLIIVACHSASTVLGNISNKPLKGMLDFTKESITVDAKKRLGIIGGGRTIESNIYANHFESLGFEVVQNNAQILSILIEAGETDAGLYKNEIIKILQPLGEIDYLLLACTHYPALLKLIKEVLDETCKVIDPMEHMYAQLKSQLLDFNAGKDVIYTTGDRDIMHKSIVSVYNLKLKSINQLSEFF